LGNLILEAAQSLIRQLNTEKSVTILIVEQKVREVLGICQRVYCLKLGKVTFSGPPQDLLGDPDKLRRAFL
jgi:ABC-type branched-subunit amino acid transport system ATPase component